MKWLPIETAPKDGSFVLLYSNTPDTLPVGIGTYAKLEDALGTTTGWPKWTEGWLGLTEDFLSRSCQPTHWMPLPPPPA
jgi:hypothetical protein